LESIPLVVICVASIAFFFFSFETGSYHVAHASPKWEILLPQLPKDWDYRHHTHSHFLKPGPKFDRCRNHHTKLWCSLDAIGFLFNLPNSYHINIVV
jgi:hypothetical protein